MDNNRRIELIQQINTVSFCMDDIRLFLDTHPCDKEAIADYNKYRSERSALMAEYVKNFGPLTSYCMNDDCEKWLWSVYPWPWEGVC